MANFKIPLTIKQIKAIFFIIVCILWIYGIVTSFEGELISWGSIRHETGELSWHLLIFTIYISLLRKLFPKVQFLSQLLVLRKYSGLFAFFLAIFHVIAHFLKVGIMGNTEQMMVHLFALNFALTFGTVSLIVMLPLALTSNVYSIKKLTGKFWRRLHKLAHIVFIFAGLHIVFLDYKRHSEIDYGAVIVLSVYVIGYIIVWTKRKWQRNKDQ